PGHLPQRGRLWCGKRSFTVSGPREILPADPPTICFLQKINLSKKYVEIYEHSWYHKSANQYDA
ncbi:MAG: hypothetical protein ACI3V4_01895, partial [Faecousia sp.]